MYTDVCGDRTFILYCMYTSFPCTVYHMTAWCTAAELTGPTGLLLFGVVYFSVGEDAVVNWLDMLARSDTISVIISKNHVVHLFQIIDT